MSNNLKKIVSIVGIIVGIVIIIIGFCVQNASGYPIGKEIRFGADFYTEIYDVTKDVGRAVNKATYNLAESIGWLIVSLGAIDICLFSYLLVKSIEDAAVTRMRNMDINSICKNLYILAEPLIQEKAKRGAEEKAKREAEGKAKRKTAEKVKREVEEKANNTEPTTKKIEKTLPEKLSYALQFHTDDGMINHLQTIENKAVQNILTSPRHLIREQIRDLLNTEEAKELQNLSDNDIFNYEGFKCPKCGNFVYYGETECKNCGEEFDIE